MGITPTALSSTITTSAMQTELARVRSWLNGGLVVGDIAALGVKRSAIYRPNVFGFPLQGAEATTQAVYATEQGSAGPCTRPGTANDATSSRLFLARTTERTSIFVDRLYYENTFRVAKVAKRIRVVASSFVEVACSWEAIVQGDYADATSGDFPEPAGTFSVYYRKVGDAATKITGSERRANVNYYAAGGSRASKFNLYSSGGAVTLSTGVYDVWLQYTRNSTTVGLAQVIIGTASLKVEVHRQA